MVIDEPTKLAWEALNETWRQGRKVLVVLGAGVSREAGVPTMTALFGELRKRVKQLREPSDKLWEEPSVTSEGEAKTHAEKRLEDLEKQLGALASGRAPRSVASMALGDLQRAAEMETRSPVDKHLHKLWLQFTQDFLEGKIPNGEVGSTPMSLEKRTPAPFHNLASHWAKERQAYVVSLNFDGLTIRALKEKMKPEGGVGVVLSRPDELSRYFTGEILAGPGKEHGMVPIIKVWGDVFHAVCKNPPCPQHDVKVPVFADNSTDESNSSHSPKGNCPMCGGPRQLQIFFTGYDQKEKATKELMRELHAYVAPEVGCVLTVGFSGLWDEALTDFLCAVAGDLQREQRNRSELAETNGNGASTWHPLPVWINVDPLGHPPLEQVAAKQGIGGDFFTHVKLKSGEFVGSDPKTPFSLPTLEKRYEGRRLPEGFWEKLVRDGDDDKIAPLLPASYEQLSAEKLDEFARLRQLGIKTRMGAGRGNHVNASLDRDHNRLRHSTGATHISVYWFRHLAKQAKKLGMLKPEDEEWLAATVLFATFHHDIGHLPFSHLAEEVFAEVHWSLEEWGDPFRHDEPVLASCWEKFREEIRKATRHTVKETDLSPYTFRSWIESAIQGRSGRHWVDAILNSPLDADKIDYVFRDCFFLHQGIHLPVRPDEREAWVRDFVGHTKLLPSGLVALAGPAGDKAREFLEERVWLYRHQYYDPGYRAVERLGSAVILHWLLQHVPEKLVETDELKNIQSGLAIIGDTSRMKGSEARKLLWEGFNKVKGEDGGEPEFLLELVEELKTAPKKGLPPPPRLKEWAEACGRVFDYAFRHPPNSQAGDILEHLTKSAGLSCSEIVYVPFEKLKEVREIVRELETLRPFAALFDVAVIPSALSYPSRRRLKLGGKSVIGECFAVSHHDPSRWGRETGQWVPLSESAFGERDRERWVQIMTLSPWPNDSSVPYGLDRFRDRCRQSGVAVKDIDPTIKP